MTNNIEYYLGRYFSRKMQKQGSFLFSHISCPVKYFDPKHKIYTMDKNGTLTECVIAKEIEEYRNITVPIFVPNGSRIFSSYEQYLNINHMFLKREIDIGTLENIGLIYQAIREALPQEITMISREELDQALKDLGYIDYQFEFQNLGSLGDGRIATRFTGTIHPTYDEIPETVTDRFIAEQLEQLYQENKLPFKMKRYALFQTTNREEYSFQNGKFIRETKPTKSEEYSWLEIKPKCYIKRGDNHVK